MLSIYLSVYPIVCTSHCRGLERLSVATTATAFSFDLLIRNLVVITGHGICSCGRCICQDGWFGKMCQHSRKCNMTEEESRSLCESADGMLCSGKGKNQQLSYLMSVPWQGKMVMFWKANVRGSGLLFSNPFLQRHLLLKRCYIWLCNAHIHFVQHPPQPYVFSSIAFLCNLLIVYNFLHVSI